MKGTAINEIAIDAATLGGFAPTSYFRYLGHIQEGADLNNYSAESGYYTIMASAENSVANSPVHWNGGATLFNIRNDRNCRYQIFFPQDKQTLYYRSIIGSTWQPWVQLSSTAVLSLNLDTMMQNNVVEQQMGGYKGILASGISLYRDRHEERRAA